MFKLQLVLEKDFIFDESDDDFGDDDFGGGADDGRRPPQTEEPTQPSLTWIRYATSVAPLWLLHILSLPMT